MNKNVISLLSICLLPLMISSCGKSSNKDISPTSSNTSTDYSEYYSVQVLNPDGSKYTSGGIYVLWCLEENCTMPIRVNEEGIARYKLTDGDYAVHLDGVPEGLTYDPNIYVATKENKHVDIKLYQRYTSSLEGDGENSKTNRYMVESDKFYKATFTSSESQKYYGFTPTSVGKYKVESFAKVTMNTDKTDPKLTYYGVNDSVEIKDDNSKDIVNFSYEFDVTNEDLSSHSSYTFMIQCSVEYESSFDFRVTSIIK